MDRAQLQREPREYQQVAWKMEDYMLYPTKSPNTRGQGPLDEEPPTNNEMLASSEYAAQRLGSLDAAGEIHGSSKCRGASRRRQGDSRWHERPVLGGVLVEGVVHHLQSIQHIRSGPYFTREAPTQ